MSLPQDATEGSFEIFYRREYSRMVSLARALSRSGGAAEDLAQEAFIAAHRHWHQVSRYDSPEAWVRRVLINRATSLHRRLGAEIRALARVGGEPAETMPELSPPANEVWDEVRKLPRRQAQATVLYYVDQLSVAEVGEVMGVSRGAVKAHLHRARTALGESLSPFNEEQQ